MQDHLKAHPHVIDTVRDFQRLALHPHRDTAIVIKEELEAIIIMASRFCEIWT